MAGCRSAEVKFSGLVRSSAMTYDRGSAGPLGDGLPAAGAMAQLVAHLLCKHHQLITAPTCWSRLATFTRERSDSPGRSSPVITAIHCQIAHMCVHMLSH